MYLLTLALVIIFALDKTKAMPIESDDAYLSLEIQKRSRGGAVGALGIAATAVVGAASLGTAAWAEHKYKQRTGNPVPTQVHHYDSSTSRQRREINASPILRLSPAILPSHNQKVIITDAEMHGRTKDTLGHAQISLGHTKGSHPFLSTNQAEVGSNAFSRWPVLSMKKRSINTEAAMAASSAASSVTKEVLQTATSRASKLQIGKTYNVKQVGGFATMAGLTGIGIGSSAHAGLSKMPKQIVRHHHSSIISHHKH